MNRACRVRGRGVRGALVAIAVAPTVIALAVVRPVPATGTQPAFGLYALTVGSAGMALDGEVGAGGGLATIDGGAPHVTGRLDSSPSALVRASSVEPGTLVRTVAGIANTEAGETVLVVPTSAEASHPGGPDQAQADATFGPETLGPWTTEEGMATATADQAAIEGHASGGQQVIAGVDTSALALHAALAAVRADFPTLPWARPAERTTTIRVVQGEATGGAEADAVSGELEARATSGVQTLDIFGEIVLTGVVGRAMVQVRDGVATPATDLVVGGATIAGIPVEVAEDGVRAGEDVELLPGQVIADVTNALDAALATAGIRIEVLQPRTQTGERFGEADSRGVRVTVVTAPTPQVPGNDLTVIVGRAVATAAWEPPFAPPAMPGPGLPDAPSDTDAAPGDTTPTATPDLAVPPHVAPVLPPAVTPPTVAVAPPEEAPTEDPTMLVVGHRISRPVALAALGAWQFLSLSTVTAAAFALRRRGTP